MDQILSFRAVQGFQKAAARFGDFSHRLLKSLFIDPGGRAKTADLSDELQGRRANVFAGGEDVGLPQNFDAATHASL
jgi:hypothetical protein